jgi:hypothetical protein
MRYLTAGICALFLAASSLASASGQEAVPQAGKLITLEVVIADVPEAAGGAPTAAAILEMEKAGKLSGLARYRLTGLENQQASVQFGELASLATGRTFARGGGGEFGGARAGAGGFGGQTTFNQISVGTHVTTVSRVESADSIVTDLKIQRSSVVPHPAAEAADPNAFVPQGTVTFNLQATVRAKPGEPLLVSGRQLRSGKEAAQTWVVLTASIAAGAPAEKRAGVGGGADDETLQVLQLVNGSASAMSNVLTGILPRNAVRIAVDERTNSLVLRGPPDQLEIARALTIRLDVEKK